MKRILHISRAVFFESLPLLITIAIWIILYGYLSELVKEHSDKIVNYGPGAVVVYLNRGRIRRMIVKTKMIVKGKQ